MWYHAPPCVGLVPHLIPRSNKSQQPFQIISNTFPNTLKHRSKTTQQAVCGQSPSVRGLWEVRARLVWASPPSMSGAQHTANNCFRRQKEFTPQSRSSLRRENDLARASSGRHRRQREAQRETELLESSIQEVGSRLRPTSQPPAGDRLQRLRERVVQRQLLRVGSLHALISGLS